VKGLVKPADLVHRIYNDCVKSADGGCSGSAVQTALPFFLPALRVFASGHAGGSVAARFLRAGTRSLYRELTSATTGVGELDNDVIDWVGGYPYEYASVKNLTEFTGATVSSGKIRGIGPMVAISCILWRVRLIGNTAR